MQIEEEKRIANTYLDSNGVSHFWEKIKGKFVQKETGKD